MDSELRKWDRFFQVAAQDNWDQTVYIYRVDRTGRKITPYAAKWAMHESLLETIKQEFGPGEYFVMIREGNTMVFTGTLVVERPLRR